LPALGAISLQKSDPRLCVTTWKRSKRFLLLTSKITSHQLGWFPATWPHLRANLSKSSEWRWYLLLVLSFCFGTFLFFYTQ